jgi:hypothetical protein
MGSPKGSKNKRIKGIKNKHLTSTRYASSLSKIEKDTIKEIQKQRSYPKEIKLSSKWNECFTGREKSKILKYINKHNQLQYNVNKLKEICYGIK